MEPILDGIVDSGIWKVARLCQMYKQLTCVALKIVVLPFVEC